MKKSEAQEAVMAGKRVGHPELLSEFIYRTPEGRLVTSAGMTTGLPFAGGPEKFNDGWHIVPGPGDWCTLKDWEERLRGDPEEWKAAYRAEMDRPDGSAECRLPGSGFMRAQIVTFRLPPNHYRLRLDEQGGLPPRGRGESEEPLGNAPDDLQAAAQPLMDYLRRQNPHVICVVTAEHAELLEGRQQVMNKKERDDA